MIQNRRQERVSKRIMQELVEAFRNLKNVDLGFITITKCEVSQDLRHAKVLVSVWGDGAKQASAMKELHRHASKLKGMIGRPLGTKVVPDLHFEFDESIANADRISRLIKDARRTDANPNPLTPEEIAALTTTGGIVSKKDRDIRDIRDPRIAAASGKDAFDAARMDVEEELFGEATDEADGGEDDDPDWRPINLDELPEDDG